MVSAVFLSCLLWLLPATVCGGVLHRSQRQLVFDEEELCRSYTLSGLRYLDCSYKELSELPNNLDYTVHVLVLSNNAFNVFPRQLQFFTELEILDLSGNNLSDPLPNFMENCQKLRTLNLSNNNYYTWFGNGHTYNIRILDLSKNKINNIDESALSEMPYLVHLDLSENRMKDLPRRLLSSSNVEELILSRNSFSAMPWFQSNTLKVLDLSNCQIVFLDADSLSAWPSIKEINLSLNQIETIPDSFTSNTLQNLDLSYNEIYQLTDQTFSSLPQLSVLNLRGNDFREVWSTSHFTSNPLLREVHVKGNRWTCEGFNVNLLLTYEYLVTRVADSSSLICYTPSNVTQLSWREAYIQTWHLGDGETTAVTAGLGVLFGIIIGIVLTSCVCRGLMALNTPEPARTRSETTALNGNLSQQSRVDGVVMRVPLHGEDQPPTYDEALLMPRLRASFHSLPDFIDEEEVVTDTIRRYRRSRSHGDLTEWRPQAADRRSVRRTVQIQITEQAPA